MMSVVVVFTVIVGLTTIELLRQTGKAEIRVNVRQASTAFDRYTQARTKESLFSAEAIAETPYLKAVLSIPDLNARTLDATVSQIVAPTCIVVAARNEVHSTSESCLIEMSALTPLLGKVFEGDRIYDTIVTGGNLWQVAIVPAFSGQQLVGAVTLLERLSSQSTLQQFKIVTGVEVGLVTENNTAVSSSHNPEHSGLVMEFSRHLQGHDPSDRILPVNTQLGEFLVLAKTLGSHGTLVLYRSADLLPATRNRIFWMIGILASSALAIGTIASLWLSARISNPIRALITATRGFGAGNIDVRVAQYSQDEIGKLASSFNQMADEIEATQRELVSSKDAAEVASEAKSTFLAMMSHEIRTPLNGVLGMVQILRNTKLNEKQSHYLDVIESSGSDLLEIINDVLDFSKIESNQLTLEEVDVDLVALINKAVSSHESTARSKGIDFRCDVSPEACLIVSSDPMRLRQVLANLLSNAVKFTSEGEVSLVVETASGSGDTANILFTISDTGIGIPPDKLDSIFESFSQADASTTRKYGGSGLGLTITKRLVDLMEGTLTVNSEPDEGTTVSVECGFTVVGKVA